MSAKSVPGRPRQRAVTRPTDRRAVLRRLAADLAIALAAVAAAAVVLVLGEATAAHAAVPGPVLAADSVEAVVNNIRTWLFALLGAVATLFLTVGGLRLMWANGDPGEAEKGKAALKSAAIGYALALLSPLIVTVVAGWVK
jgi:Type IV secretion system pilin